jgi:hypothetical protein
VSLARLAIWVLSAGATLLVLLILGHTGSHDFEAKVFAAMLLFVLFSFISLAGFLLIERQPDLAFFGAVAVGLAVTTFVVAFEAILANGLSINHVSIGNLLIITLAAGQASMLLAFRRDDDSPLVNATVLGSLLMLALLAVLAVVDISSPGSDVGAKTYTIVAVLYLLGALLPPCLRWAEAEESY